MPEQPIGDSPKRSEEQAQPATERPPDEGESAPDVDQPEGGAGDDAAGEAPSGEAGDEAEAAEAGDETQAGEAGTSLADEVRRRRRQGQGRCDQPETGSEGAAGKIETGEW